MDQVDLAEPGRLFANALNPSQQFAAIPVRAVAVQNLYMGTQRYLIPENPNSRSLFDDSASECMFGLESHYKDGVSRIRRAIQQVVEDPSRFGHA